MNGNISRKGTKYSQRRKENLCALVYVFAPLRENFLCFSTMRSGVAKKSNSSRRRFKRYRSYEKCNPGLPPDVKTTNVGGRTPTCVKYCTFSRENPPFAGDGAVPPRGCAMARSKKSLSCAVGIRRLRASSAFKTSDRILSTR